MAKIIGFIRRRDDLDFVRFSRHWRTTHRDHALKLRAWLKGYVQNHLRPGPIADMQRPADGCPALWVDDVGDMTELAASDAFRAGAYLDEPLFMEGRSSGLPVEEHILVHPGADAAIKLMLFLGLRPEATPDTLFASSAPAHANGHIRNLALTRDGLDPAYAFDIVEEIWWPDAVAYAADLATVRQLVEHRSIDPARTKAALVEELIVIPPPR